MKRLAVLAVIFLAMLLAPLNALAATYIQDNGNMFSSGAKNQATQLIDNMVRRTGKEVLVYTVPSLNGQDPSAAADSVFQQNRVNGVLLYMSAQDRRLEIKVGADTRQAISTTREAQIRDHILSDFRNNQFDKGLIDGINDVNSSLPAAGGTRTTTTTAPAAQRGPNWVLIGILIVIALVVVWIIAGIVNARRQQPYFSYGQQGPGYGPGPGYGGGYGPGWGGGGGGFFSGLMGGLGGALLGNALFDAFRPRDRFYDGGGYQGYQGGGEPGGFVNQGWQGDDAGQVSDSGADAGSWGDSGGGGGDWGGGGGDFGGGGDSGGGDSGGSW
ncbi:MAG TPA: TPM domain-containing protein [Chloroflexota bacterium]|nr:TPM domain-containing protein [Chloroflexota bacterium]